ncbi:FadR/GntR family transcriptional regulator [Streptomyces sp. NBC_01237]|uniref:FadR/GntR family transcriptional regulator n=1 Tax=Streptomyces sp. NBC_01237 TaxID=2903790 RepID=UPI002DDB73D7|nr:FadR/GntR family transcriptional regulator [Streptomyces sp. NBC_01237]WRZ72592.1 FadR family transcriptional regulator [Streptomyces sp. NBC_01237]
MSSPGPLGRPLGPLRPSPLVEQATDHLREQITGGQWPVGTKIPGETTLAKTLGVGRSTVREAVRALAATGLVQARQGAGVFVIADRPHEDWPTRLRRAAVTDVYEVRMIVEVEAARLAAERRTEDDLVALDGAMAARRAASSWGDAEFVDADIALHRAVVAAAHNPVLTDLFAEFAPALRQGLIDLVDLLDLRTAHPGHGEDTHAALVRAVVAGDAQEAARTARAELEATLGMLRGA